MKRATQSDMPALTSYLAEHAELNMFTLSNLNNHGLDGDHPRGTRLWMNNGPLRDVLAVTQEGMVMPFLPDGGNAAAATVLGDLGGLIGMIGPASHVRALQSAAGLTDAPATMDEDEPQFLLQLDELIIPDGIGELIPFAQAPEATVRDWMADYQRNALHTPADQVAGYVKRDYEERIKRGSHMVLVDGNTCLAATGFNAQMPDIVQIGGVYTPPELRGRGHARRAVALHLELARRQGIGRATLFSASDMAERAYRAIGFEQIGDWTLLLFDGPQVAHV